MKYKTFVKFQILNNINYLFLNNFFIYNKNYKNIKKKEKYIIIFLKFIKLNS